MAFGYLIFIIAIISIIILFLFGVCQQTVSRTLPPQSVKSELSSEKIKESISMSIKECVKKISSSW